MTKTSIVLDIEEMLKALGFYVIYDKNTSSSGQDKGGYNLQRDKNLEVV